MRGAWEDWGWGSTGDGTPSRPREYPSFLLRSSPRWVCTTSLQAVFLGAVGKQSE